MRGLEGRTEAEAGTFNAQSVTNTLRAYAMMGREPRAGVMRGLEERADAIAGTFNAHNVSNTLWAYAKMGREPRAELMRVLEGRTEAIVGKFDAQHVSNTLWAYAKMGREPGAELMRSIEGRAEALAGTFDAWGVGITLWAYATMGREPGAELMRAMEERAEVVMTTFNAQNVANTLWAYAKMGREPGAGVMRGLEERAEAKAGSFMAQEVANTLWAYATMGREPGEGLMRGLGERAEALAGSFKAQDVANTLWAASVFSSLDASKEASRWVQVVAQRLVSLSRPACFDTVHLCQLHQFFVSCSMEEKLCVEALDGMQDLKEVCRSAFVGKPTAPSATQQQVSETLRSMGLSVKDETRCPTSGYSIDMLVHDSALAIEGKGGRVSSGGTWAVEFDGPWHFLGTAADSGLSCRAPTDATRLKGKTRLKRRHLQLLGHALVTVNYWEWAACSGAGDREQYLRSKLGACGPSAAHGDA